MSKRTRGLTLLTFLLLFEGFLNAANQILLIVYGHAAGDSVILPVISLLFSILLFCGTAIGIWRYKPWAWWLIVYHYTYGALNALRTIFLIPAFLESPTVYLPVGPLYTYLKYAGQIASYLFILGYLGTNSVFTYFGLLRESKVKAYFIVSVVALAVLLLSSLWLSV